MSLTVPKSVHAYFTNANLRGAINMLLGNDASHFDTSLKTDEQRNYRNAWLAAQQMRVEYINFLEDLWHVLWSAEDLSKTQGTFVNAAELKRLEYESSSIETLWDGDYFARTIRLPNYGSYISLTIYLDTTGNQHGISLGAELYDSAGAESLLNENTRVSAGWRIDDDEVLPVKPGLPYNDLVIDRDVREDALEALRKDALDLLYLSLDIANGRPA